MWREPCGGSERVLKERVLIDFVVVVSEKGCFFFFDQNA